MDIDLDRRAGRLALGVVEGNENENGNEHGRFWDWGLEDRLSIVGCRLSLWGLGRCSRGIKDLGIGKQEDTVIRIIMMAVWGNGGQTGGSGLALGEIPHRWWTGVRGEWLTAWGASEVSITHPSLLMGGIPSSCSERVESHVQMMLDYMESFLVWFIRMGCRYQNQNGVEISLCFNKI